MVDRQALPLLHLIRSDLLYVSVHYLTYRVGHRWAGSFEELLLDAPRTNTPLHLPLAPSDGATWVPHPADDWPWDPPELQQAGEGSTSKNDSKITAPIVNVTHFDDGKPRPHHCPSLEMVCPGVVAVSPKQRKHITLYSRLTTTPEPDVEAMVSSVEAMLMLRLATVVLLRGLDVDR